MIRWHSAVLFCFLILNFYCTCENFNEELLIHDVGQGYISFHFNFVTRATERECESQFHSLYPRSFVNIIRDTDIHELHLSLARGFWNEHWGSKYQMIAPSGAELWIWFSNKTKNFDQSWFDLTHTLSGLYCASLNQLSTRSHFITPSWSYRPYGALKLGAFGRLHYAQLPGESLCSENLTPWAKLLPCKRLKGLGSLLQPTALMRASYNSISVSVRRVCIDVNCTTVSLEFAQTLTAVFDRRILYGDAESPWTLKGIMGTGFKGVCDVADKSFVFFRGPSQPTIYNSSLSFIERELERKRILFSFPSSQLPIFETLPLHPVLSGQTVPMNIRSAYVSATKYVTGTGNLEGGIKCLITNKAHFPIKIIYLDLIPWYTQVLFNTLNLDIVGGEVGERNQIIPDRMSIRPSLARRRMGMLELVVTLPPDSQLVISYEFRKLLQRWNEFPPDANHGFVLSPAVISYQLSQNQLNQSGYSNTTILEDTVLPIWASTYTELFNISLSAFLQPRDGFVRLHTPAVLVTIPTPDFSMPFNVLCLVCSVVSILFGTVHKCTTTAIIAKLSSTKESRLKCLVNYFLSYVARRSGASDSHVQTERQKIE